MWLALLILLQLFRIMLKVIRSGGFWTQQRGSSVRTRSVPQR